ncbi:MAG: hypothetical protein NZ843_02380, partial [Fimbriimonadales bacterium]|nr:hypothetical protein [Fimbriimonadales bacterium]
MSMLLERRRFADERRFALGIIPCVAVERSERDKRRAKRLGRLGYLLARGLGRTVRLYVEGWEQIER